MADIDEIVIQSYIRDKLAPFDDYQFDDQDAWAVEQWVRANLK